MTSWRVKRLYTAILDPNAAISFGYEGVAIEAGDGRKLIGYVASDGDQEVAIKVPGGALITVKADEIKERKPLAGFSNALNLSGDNEQK